MLTIAMQKLLPEDVNDCLHVLTILYRQNLADNASYVAPPLDGNGTQLIVETKSPTTKNNETLASWKQRRISRPGNESAPHNSPTVI